MIFREVQITIWLGTEPQTRAEQFYQMQGWKAVGAHKNGGIHFETLFENWTETRKTGKEVTVSEIDYFGKGEIETDYIFGCTQEPYSTKWFIPFLKQLK